jgi:hypothetical protein
LKEITFTEWLDKPFDERTYKLLPKEWKHWVNNGSKRCHGRALKYLEKHSNREGKSKRKAWKDAIVSALANSDGIAKFSGHPLRLNQPSTNSTYPSIDHCDNVLSTNISIVIRLVNDMKSIMSDTEFISMVENIFSISQGKGPTLDLTKLPCSRDFAG